MPRSMRSGTFGNLGKRGDRETSGKRRQQQVLAQPLRVFDASQNVFNLPPLSFIVHGFKKSAQDGRWPDLRGVPATQRKLPQKRRSCSLARANRTATTERE